MPKPFVYRKVLEIEYHQGQCACKCVFDPEEAELIKKYPVGLEFWKREYISGQTQQSFKEWIKEH